MSVSMIATLLIIIAILLLGYVYMGFKIIMKKSEIEMLKDALCFTKDDLLCAWNGGFTEAVKSERGHPEKNFHEWYQFHKSIKKYGK